MEAQKQKLKRTQKEISKPEDFTDPEEVDKYHSGIPSIYRPLYGGKGI